MHKFDTIEGSRRRGPKKEDLQNAVVKLSRRSSEGSFFFSTMANDFIYPVTAEGNLIVLNNFKMISCAFLFW